MSGLTWILIVAFAFGGFGLGFWAGVAHLDRRLERRRRKGLGLHDVPPGTAWGVWVRTESWGTENGGDDWTGSERDAEAKAALWRSAPADSVLFFYEARPYVAFRRLKTREAAS